MFTLKTIYPAQNLFYQYNSPWMLSLLQYFCFHRQFSVYKHIHYDNDGWEQQRDVTVSKMIETRSVFKRNFHDVRHNTFGEGLKLVRRPRV
jgi:hypothetical protein